MLLKPEINQHNLQIIQNNILKYSPHPEKVSIIAVTKKKPYQAIESAFAHKINIVGESTIQETENKLRERVLPKNKEIHLIGHLQSNKVKKAIKIYNVIHSVDTIKLINKINSAAKKQEKKQKIFLQIKTNKKNTQKGFFEEEIYKAAEHATQKTNLLLLGIMGIGPNTRETKRTNKVFKNIKKHQKQIEKNINPKAQKLSIGMSQDYILALQNGATHIRIGTMLYKQEEKHGT